MGVVTKPASGMWANQTTYEKYGLQVESNGDSIADQYGTTDYVSLPQDYVHESNTTLPNGVINANRLKSTQTQEASWLDRMWSYVKRTATYAPFPINATVIGIGASTSVAKAVPEAAGKVKAKVKSWLWKLVFIIVIVFVGYFFFKTVAIKYAGKV